MIAEQSGPFFGHNITSRRKHALWGSRSGRYSENFPPQEGNPWPSGTTEEARLNSVRGFLCDGIACRRILLKTISSSAMSELDLLRGREEAEGSLGYIEESPRCCSSGTSWVCPFFLARNICTTNFSHPILVRRNRHLSRYSVCPSC